MAMSSAPNRDHMAADVAVISARANWIEKCIRTSHSNLHGQMEELRRLQQSLQACIQRWDAQVNGDRWKG